MPKGLNYELKSKITETDQDGAATISIAPAEYTVMQIRAMVGDLLFLARKIENDDGAEGFPDKGEHTWES